MNAVNEFLSRWDSEHPEWAPRRAVAFDEDGDGVIVFLNLLEREAGSDLAEQFNAGLLRAEGLEPLTLDDVMEALQRMDGHSDERIT